MTETSTDCAVLLPIQSILNKYASWTRHNRHLYNLTHAWSCDGELRWHAGFNRSPDTR